MSDQARQLLRDALRARRILGHDVEDPGPSALEDADGVRHWFDERRDDVVAAVLEGDETSVALLAHVWRALPPDADEAWCRRLYDCATPLAAALPRSRPLAAAFRAGAEVLRERGLHRLAAALGMRELAVHRLLDDPEPTVDALTSLAAAYRAQGRLHRVIGCADEVLELRIVHEQPEGIARALAHLGALMIEAGRLTTAVNYLTRADKVFDGLPPTPDRARTQVVFARALWLSGDEAAARRRLHRVLPDLTGEDARQARELLDLPTGSTPGSGAQQRQDELDQQSDG
ncbi:tetratricopeptide (TPR) repeat protein [Saccharothrix tamanrassetensis]|uniref:Tetratricopeptide (TPR) repeat protein n=1 Tax=Saccharothrix tamanrassetensis TaxID=1051531 RepID=A0A841CGI0_9PSEU|nr:hypothetical protein [Saccharothrix tamanrassetensis]MBB5956419.1 tetratricopeptide (TPR) repeat protein [Saccharothrix tamanrassetensis]